MAAKRAAKKELEPVRFVTVEQVFQPQVKVMATRDLSGWADRGDKSGKRVKWHIGIGRVGHLDADVAREFNAKGFVEILEGEVKPVSEAEMAEFLSQVTTISVGGPNG